MLDKTKKDNRIKVLRGQLQKIAAKGDIIPTKYNDPFDKSYGKTITMKPRTFLELSSDGASRKKTTLSDAHSNPKGSSDRNVNRLSIEDDLRWVDYPKNSEIREMSEKQRNDLSMTNDINYNVRGDELGGVEYYKRKIRQGEPIGVPDFSISSDEKRITGHEGRHRSRALMEEGEKRIPVNINAYSGARADQLGIGFKDKSRFNMKGIKRQNNSEKSDKDTRAPIFGRYSKLKVRLQKIATDINRSPVDNTMSKSDEIINSFKNSGLSIEGVDGVYDTENHKILDANNSDDVERLRGLYGKDKYIGTNSETDTRDGPNTNDLERTRKELQDIEDKGGIPALGFDSTEGGSLEALNVSVVNSKEEVLQALNKNQWGTGILHPNGKFEIVKSLKYIGRNK